MTRRRSTRVDELLDDEYRENLDEMATERLDVTYEEVESVFLRHCEEVRRELRDRTPAAVIRRVAFQKTKRSLERNRTVEME